MNQRKDGDPQIAGAATSPDDAPEAKRRSAEPVDRSERRMTAEQQRRLRDLCQRSGSQFEERLTHRVDVLADRIEAVAKTVSISSSANAAKDGELVQLRREL